MGVVYFVLAIVGLAGAFVIAHSVRTPSPQDEKTMVFSGQTLESAHTAELRWANDLSEHSSINLSDITMAQKDGKFIATVTYLQPK